MDAARSLLFGILILLLTSTGTAADSINQKVVTFLKSKVGTRVGGGECAQAVSEALRVSGAAFAEGDLGPDNPDAGDYVWGTLVKVVSYTDEILVDSEPSTKVLPGDILQYHDCRFVIVTVTGKGTRTKTIVAAHHTSVAAKIDDAGLSPLEVYEQNAISVADANADARQVKVNALDLSGLRAGWVRIYRPKARVDKPGKFQISLVNSMPEAQEANIKFDGSVVDKISLTEADTGTSYTLPLLSSTSTLKKFSIVLPNGPTVVISNASGYEIYAGSNGAPAIRKLTN